MTGLKLFDGKTWDWYYFLIAGSDAKQIDKLRQSRTIRSPTIQKVHGCYEVRFCFEEDKELIPDEQISTALCIDLGVGAPASWCMMAKDGTVRKRGVIHLKREEDRLRHLIGRKKQYQRAGKQSHSIYRLLNHANKELAIQTTKQIIKTAEVYHADVIVFEYLDTSGKKRGAFKERLHLWRKSEVQERVTLQAHRRGMRISRVCAWGTSKLAFDGSGEVKRGKAVSDQTPYSICRFQTGKLYNCDLNAAYNIGARYFLRRLAAKQKDLDLPCVPKRTLSTLTAITQSVITKRAA